MTVQVGAPQPVAPKTSTQNNEVAIATSISDVNRYFQPLIFKRSRNSPPLTTDVNEGTLVFDIQTGRLWTKINNVLKSVQFA